MTWDAERFFGPWKLVLEPNDTYTFHEDVEFYSTVTQKSYVIPTGFNTDFASVPRLPFAYYLAGGRYPRAASAHDLLYRKGLESRAVCDKIFYELMAATDERMKGSWVKKRGRTAIRSLMWFGVRVGGRSHHVDTSATSVPADEPAKSISD